MKVDVLCLCQMAVHVMNALVATKNPTDLKSHFRKHHPDVYSDLKLNTNTP